MAIPPSENVTRLLVKARSHSGGGIALESGNATSGSLVATPLMPHVHETQQRMGLAADDRQWFEVQIADSGASPWDLAHAMRSDGLGLVSDVEFAEPDLPQSWDYTKKSRTGPADAQDPAFPTLPDNDWYRDATHGGFRDALVALGTPKRIVRVAHLDTGYDPDHRAMPANINTGLARNFVDKDRPFDAADRIQGGLITNHGHGTGTMSILAGSDPSNQGKAIGAAPFVEVVPIRVADRVELIWNSAIARALDYVLGLKDDPESRIDIVTMSMGGLPARAWADAVNALYDAGIFVVTAAGNNFGNLPTRNIVYPARFNRVVAACGVMANGKPYANLGIKKMAGNYGPGSKMRTAMAAATPNLPWARIGSGTIVDHDGVGTSASTPQIAAAAAIWLAGPGSAMRYSQPWMQVEAIRAALFSTAHGKDTEKLGHGAVDAAEVLKQTPPAETELHQEAPDTTGFAFLKTLLGLGMVADPARQAMFELEALQLAQQEPLCTILPDPDADPASLSPDQRGAAVEALIKKGSNRLRLALEAAQAPSPAGGGGPTVPLPPATASSPADTAQEINRESKLARALERVDPPPRRRKVRIFASDPTSSANLETYSRATVTVDLPWEPLKPGPIGEYIEVVDVDPASNAAYAPVDLDSPYLLHERGLTPSETDPRFHQQMSYAVASRTIEHFERALGRRALWSPYFDQNKQSHYVQRLRIYPHALRMANAYYSPDKKALLLGYFKAVGEDGHDDIARPTVFAALSHDIIAHETAHALLDGLHRRFIEATNPDCLAFHEAFADIVAMFLHFTLPDAVRPEIAATRGDLFAQNRLGQLAFQFGQSMGARGALRDYIGTIDDQGVWHRRKPSLGDYSGATEAHDRGAVLVAAVFDAFLQIYETEAREIFALATGGSGIAQPGALASPLVDALTKTACKIAARFLDILIRALDYCPPFDLTFGEYLRAVITADRDLIPDDVRGYRVAIAAAFRARGISPVDVRSVSPDTLAWEAPDISISFDAVIKSMLLDWRDDTRREEIFRLSRKNAAIFHDWLISADVPDLLLDLLGIKRTASAFSIPITDADGNQRQVLGLLRGPEVHSVRTLRRVGPDGTIRNDLIIEITQSFLPVAEPNVSRFRGGCTLIIDRATGLLHQLVRKRIGNEARFAAQANFAGLGAGLGATYFSNAAEPFAALHLLG